MVPLSPLFYFDENRTPVWSITPDLPAGLLFDNGTISGTPTVASNFTKYTVTVTGQMVPVELYVSIEVIGAPNLVVESVRNESQNESGVYVIPEYEEQDTSFSMFWVCPPIFALIAIMLSVTLSRLIESEEEEEEQEDSVSEDQENGGGEEESPD